MAPSTPNYGSVPQQEQQQDDEEMDTSFDADRTYYLKTTLSPEEKCRKWTLIAVPILAAVIIIGSAAFFLLRDFNYLYPGRGESSNFPSDRGHSVTTVTQPAPAPSIAVPVPVPSSSTKKSQSIATEAACSAYPLCVDLEGDCCPTAEGINLDCCAST